MRLALITPPADEPVDILDVKADLRVTTADEDARLIRLIREARESIDGPLTSFGRALMTQTWDATLDCVPDDGDIILPTAPVQSIVSVTRELDGIEQEISMDDYEFLNGGASPRIAWVDGASPRWDRVRVRFVAGYASADDVPGPIKQAIIRKVQQAFDGIDLSAEITALLNDYRIIR